MLIDFQLQSNAAKRKGLGTTKRYHYLFFIATAADARGKGLCSGIIRQFQNRVQNAAKPEDRIPIWLEASTARSQRVYARCGFTLVQTMTMGKGTHDAEGLPSKGGAGVEIYAMIWKPEDVNSAKHTC